ncbi:MAG TPA: hypothetical protein VGM50_12155, partial [Gemmatimonadaceae bacterium]
MAHSPKQTTPRPARHDGFVHVRGARENNLKNIDVEIPRDAFVVFTGISGSGKSSLAFGTLYAEAQRRYLESVSPYARRLFDQMEVPDVDDVIGLPPAVALRQQRGAPSSRSSVGSVTTLSNLVRMLYSRVGAYPRGAPRLEAEDFSPNTPMGACPNCHGLGRVYDATEKSMVPDPLLTIRERAIAAWPGAWQGQNQRDILTSMGYDIDIPWREMSKKDRDWILFTDEQPVVPVWAHLTLEQVKRARKTKQDFDYNGTFTSARRYVMDTFANTESASMKKRAAQFLVSTECPRCHGKRLKPESLAVKFADCDIAELSRFPFNRLAEFLQRTLNGGSRSDRAFDAHPEKLAVAHQIIDDIVSRIAVLLDLGLGYLSLERGTPTLSPGELQRLRIATQVRSNLFGVVYVLDEPSAGLHPADTESLLNALDGLKRSGNSLFVVEHDLDVIRHADWIVDVGPLAGEHGGRILYSGAPKGLAHVEASHTRRYLCDDASIRLESTRTPRAPSGWLRLTGISRNNLRDLAIDIPLGVFTTVTGVSGSGKSSLVSQALVELVGAALGHPIATVEDEEDNPLTREDPGVTHG